MQEIESKTAGSSFSAQKLDDLCLWSGLGVYALAWIWVLFVAVPQPWFFAPVAAAAYVGMHVYAIRAHGYCYMFADSYAGPVATAVIAATWLMLPLLHIPRPPIPNVVLGGAAAFFLGHVAVYLFTRILKISLRRRVVREAP